jgi:hypothetical protein
MAGIEDLITLYRGEAPSRFNMDFRDLRGTYYTKDKDFAKYMAQGGSRSANKLIGDLKGTVKKLEIPKNLFEKLGGSDFEVNIKDSKLLGKAKTDVLQTILARVGSLTPLAMKGLNALTSLPAATITAFLQSTPANADEANMKLEDFAKLIEMEGMVDKQLPSKPKDI